MRGDVAGATGPRQQRTAEGLMRSAHGAVLTALQPRLRRIVRGRRSWQAPILEITHRCRRRNGSYRHGSSGGAARTHAACNRRRSYRNAEDTLRGHRSVKEVVSPRTLPAKVAKWCCVSPTMGQYRLDKVKNAPFNVASCCPTPASDKEVMQFIFRPGFSTAEKVTISGRGVGMDVVHSETKQLNGNIKIPLTRVLVLRSPYVSFTVSVNRPRHGHKVVTMPTRFRSIISKVSCVSPY